MTAGSSGPSVAALRSGYLSGRSTVTEVIERYLSRIEPAPGRLAAGNAVVATNCELAMRRARELDDLVRRTGRLAGPLHGVPVLVKDNLETADLPTAYGVWSLRAHQVDQDAAVVAQVRRAGAVIVGKASTPDLAMSLLSISSASGATANPYRLDLDCGGSSAGSAAGVASDLAVLAIGSDTSGSLRVPASFAQAVALRPTTGLLSTEGMSALVRWQDTPGPIARSAPDLAALLDAMCCPLPGSTLSARYADGLRGASLVGRRIGVLDLGEWAEWRDEGVSAVMARAVGELSRAGAILEEVSLPGLRQLLREGAIFASHARADVDAFLRSRRGVRYDSLAQMARAGEAGASTEMAELVLSGPIEPSHDPTLSMRLRGRRLLAALLTSTLSAGQFHALCYPTSMLLAPFSADVVAGRVSSTPYAALARIAAQADLPAITVPAGTTGDGVPVGLELLGRPFGEMGLLRLAAAYEQAAPHRRPPPSARPDVVQQRLAPHQPVDVRGDEGVAA